MNRSSAPLRRAFALVVAIGVVALVGVAWTTHEQSVRLDETAGWADRTRASVAAVQADDAVALTAEHPDQALALLRDDKGVQMRRDIEGFANAMVANEDRRFDERIVIGRNARHAAETYAGVALMLLVAVMAAAAIFILRELKLRAAVTAALMESRGRLELGERRLRAIADNMPAYIGYVDKTETYRFTNAAFSTLFGVPYEAFIGRTMTEMMGRRTRDELAAYVEGALAGREMHFERHGMALQADSTFMVSYIPDFDKSGGVDGYYVMSLDITARKKAELELANSERRLRTITDNLPVLISYIDKDERYQFCNRTYGMWMAIDAAGMIGRSLAEVLGPEEYAKRDVHLRRTLAGARADFDIESTWLGVHRHLHGTYVPDIVEGRVEGIYVLVSDVSAEKAAETKLALQARTDSLTGLANRHAFNEKLAEALARSRRTEMPIALFFLDVDKFKGINDTLGHAAGDAVLKIFAERLVASVRETDTVARLAGDEFVVILESLHTPAEPQFIARKILATMGRPFDVAGVPLKVTTSIGIVWQADGHAQPSELLAMADKALYEAKDGGRNTFRLASA